ncbi:MAG: hypothetical protein NWS99_04030 [Paracoccaceae bacterium]|jgi:hypothetical protein|nr:hypothetical protein [Paracoccaceae bacterium]MDP5345281.1 hypothetical protein [Paracoccaceae bacterium]
MNYLMWLMRAKRWAHRPPSMRRVLMVAGVVALSLTLAGIEHFWGWPDALSVNHKNGPKLPRF